MIRKAELTDIFNISKMEAAVLGSTLGVDFFYNELSLNDMARYYVYTINDEIVGYVGFRLYDNEAEMMNFVINHDYQNKGYGQELLDYFLAYIKTYPIYKISLEVRKSNKKAIRFYIKNGFTKSHNKKNYYMNEDAYVYIKEVNL